MTPQRKTQVAITVASLALVGVHLLCPNLRIDAVTLILLAAAAIPWLVPLFKSVELPGGLKLEFQNLQTVKQHAAEAGLLDELPDLASPHKHSFQIVADEDANLALAGLRIEIERRLVRLAEETGVGSTKMSIRHLLRLLGDQDILTLKQCGVLEDMIGLLNSAAHGASADYQSAQWALEVGPRLLATLDKRAETQ